MFKIPASASAFNRTLNRTPTPALTVEVTLAFVVGLVLLLMPVGSSREVRAQGALDPTFGQVEAQAGGQTSDADIGVPPGAALPPGRKHFLQKAVQTLDQSRETLQLLEAKMGQLSPETVAGLEPFVSNAVDSVVEAETLLAGLAEGAARNPTQGSVRAPASVSELAGSNWDQAVGEVQEALETAEADVEAFHQVILELTTEVQ